VIFCCCCPQALIEFCQLLFILRLVLVEAGWSGTTHWLYNIISLPGAATQSLVSFECMMPPTMSPEERAYWWLAAALLTPGVWCLLPTGFNRMPRHSPIQPFTPRLVLGIACIPCMPDVHPPLIATRGT
jgi:hypothetical protein